MIDYKIVKVMASIRNHISVCICTYKRPELLAHLLSELQNQITDQSFTYSIVVVDNDQNQSAKSTAETFKGKSLIDIDYYNEPEQNIALARNKAVENAKSNYVAFIDDDEFPVNNWLMNLHKTLLRYKVDGVLGPVKPHFEVTPPDWILKGKICEKSAFKTGTIFKNSRYTRTGNVLLNYEIFKDNENMFDPEFGTGSEDNIFFRNLIQKGYIFVSCNEAPVYESISPDRMKKTYFIRRALLDGANSAKLYKSLSFIRTLSIYLKTTLAISVYSLGLPFVYLFGDYVFMKVLIKNCNHIGRLLSFMGIKVIKERNF